MHKGQTKSKPPKRAYVISGSLAAEDINATVGDETLAEIVVKAGQGDMDAFEVIVARFQDMAVGYAYSILGDHGHAQDVAQEAFIQVYTNLHTLRDPAAFAGWFKAVVFSCCTRLTRRKHVDTVDLARVGPIAGEGMGPAQAYEQKRLREEVWDTIHSLPEQQRSVLVLYHMGGFSYKEIGSFLGLSQSTVTNRLHAARKTVKRKLWCVVEETVQGMRVSRDSRFVRRVIADIPRVGFFSGGTLCPEDIPFPSVMRAYLKHVGQDYGWTPLTAHGQEWKLDTAATFFAGVTGAVFRFFWNHKHWQYGWIDPAYMTAYGDRHIARALEAAGYDYELLLSDTFATQLPYAGRRFTGEADVRARIVESIRDQDRPVIAFGVVGPAEPCIVAGYDEDGAVLIGWSYFQDELKRQAGLSFEPCGYFCRRDWYDDTFGILMIGDRRPKPPLRDVYRKALEWGVELLRRTRVAGFPVGWASYDEWAGEVLRDASFPPDDPAALRQAAECIDPTIWELAERRWYGARFLDQILAREAGLPEGPLCAAAACFDAEHDMMWEIAGLSGVREKDPVGNLGSPAVRRQIADKILEARDKDIKAAEHLERALAQWQ